MNMTLLIGVTSEHDEPHVVIQAGTDELTFTLEEAEFVWYTMAAVMDRLSEAAHDKTRREAEMERAARRERLT